jgi:hypothetical protein
VQFEAQYPLYANDRNTSFVKVVSPLDVQRVNALNDLACPTGILPRRTVPSTI